MYSKIAALLGASVNEKSPLTTGTLSESGVPSGIPSWLPSNVCPANVTPDLAVAELSIDKSRNSRASFPEKPADGRIFTVVLSVVYKFL